MRSPPTLGDDLGEVGIWHGDLAGAGDLGVEDVIGEIGPARDAEMQEAAPAVRPTAARTRRMASLWGSTTAAMRSRAAQRELLAAIDGREAAGGFRNRIAGSPDRCQSISFETKRESRPLDREQLSSERASRTILHLL